ncbi:MAG: hypothetical protein ACI9HK_000435 [Pirellulaceae bacterium]|jgi:hypothetical protein
MTEKPPQRRWFSFQLRTLLILMALCCLGMYAKIQWDWHQKLKVVEGWAATVQVDDDWDFKNAQTATPVLPVSGKNFSKEEQLAMLQIAAISLDDPKMQVGCLKLMVELHPADALKYLYKIAVKGRGTEVRVNALRLIGIHRNVNSVKHIRPLLDDSNPAVRGGAAECLGLIHCPSYDTPPSQQFSGLGGWIDCRPPIQISILGQTIFNISMGADSIPADEIKLPLEIRKRIVEIMVDGETDDERMGAARALVRWQPENYKLRYAEWGVWISSGGELELVHSVLDEIPEFVHRTGDPIQELESERVNQIFIINKPIAHITVDQPLAVDVSAYIHQGRPWFAFPRPNNYVVGVGQVSGFSGIGGGDFSILKHTLAGFDGAVTGLLENPHDGYPWLVPRIARVGPVGGSMSMMNSISDVGVRWQSVICSPTKRHWMSPPKVAKDAKYQWWERLRKVQSSWLSNMDESERFLYYDGPTNVSPPTFTVYKKNSLEINENDMFSQSKSNFRSVLNPELIQTPTTQNPSRHVLLIRVEAGEIAGEDRPLTEPKITIDLTQEPPLSGDQVAAKLLELLTKYGLTQSEAMGLIDAWRPQFFQTNGLRLLTIMTPADYDRCCPLLMQPLPTEVVRVGIVLQELPQQELP